MGLMQLMHDGRCKLASDMSTCWQVWTTHEEQIVWLKYNLDCTAYVLDMQWQPEQPARTEG